MDIKAEQDAMKLRWALIRKRNQRKIKPERINESIRRVKRDA